MHRIRTFQDPVTPIAWWGFVAAVLTIGWLATPTPLGAQPATGIDEFEDTDIGFAYIPDRDFEITGGIDIVQTGAEDRSFFIVIDGGNSSDVDNRAAVNPEDESDTVEYELHNPQTGEIIRDLDGDTPSSSEVLSGELPGAESGPWRTYATVDVLLHIEEGQLEDPDPDYSDTLTMRLYYGHVDDPDSYDPEDPEATAELEVTGNVDPFVEVALVEPGESYPPGRPGPRRETEREMSFGVLEPGDNRAYDLLVQANTLFTVTVESFNGGVLAYEGTNGEDSELPTEVPYAFRVDGEEVDLSDGAIQFGTDLFGFRWPLEAEILDFGVPVAGDYRDTVTITVSADQ